MDFAAIGESMAMATAISRARQAVDAADQEIIKANGIIARKNRELDELRWQLAAANAHIDGLSDQAKALRLELTRIHPANRLIQPTGRSYTNQPQLACHLIFEKTFDASAVAAGLPSSPERYRPCAS